MGDANLLISLSTLLDQNEANHSSIRDMRSDELLQNCISKLKLLSIDQQRMYLALLYKTLGAEYFVGSQWQLFYKIYNDKLRLRFGDILLVLKKLAITDHKNHFKIAS